MDWRVLVVDDKAADDVAETIGGNKTVPKPDSISCEKCADFFQAVELLKNQRFDLVILDLKDDGAPEQETLAGERVFEEIKKCRFVPVVFHTGFPHKVGDQTSPYVRVVTRADWENLRSTIKEVLDTKLPRLIRHIEEEQRRFMWESAERIWADDLHKDNPTDLVYLLARRLANSLSGDVVRSFFGSDGTEGAPKSEMVHAVELYIFPPISQHFLFGDIFEKKTSGKSEYFVSLTPSCDHAQRKAEFLLFARCADLSDSEEWKKVQGFLEAKTAPSKSAVNDLKELMKDNNPRPRLQDRYKYLPGTSFIPDLLVDLQNTLTIDREKLVSGEAGLERIASLDSPFSEYLQAKMIRYFGRVGTPSLDTDLTFERFKSRTMKT
ncbi:hypothetical protein [Azoarcus olearius]|uniref:Response regulatory domain-containing protein n=1 Tax=Azoarcus sp. (strain BH72) TaxID=418699 RepID=A1K2B9_AZOSB|nr:hypothetical protein [Azoarcus olearius]CAL92974.1 hypothetical protein azo0357 [Azoarcus olearius]